MRIVTEKLYLRPSLDFVFDNEEDLEQFFIAEIVELLPSTESIKNLAIEYFINYEGIWYINTDVCTEVIPSEINTCNKTEMFLQNLINSTEYNIEEVWNNLSNSNYEFQYFYLAPFMKRDAYTELFKMIDKKVFFEKSLNDIIYIDFKKIDEQWLKLKHDISNKKEVYIRGYGRDAKKSDFFF